MREVKKMPIKRDKSSNSLILDQIIFRYTNHKGMRKFFYLSYAVNFYIYGIWKASVMRVILIFMEYGRLR